MSTYEPVSIYATKVKIQTERFMYAMWYVYVCTYEATHGIHLYVHVLFIIFFVGKCDLYENLSFIQGPLCVRNI